MNLRRSLSRYVIALAVLTVSGSSFHESSAQRVTPPAQSSESKGGSPADPKVASDESLTSEEYLRLGLPAQDRDWSAEDMAKAEKILALLARKGYRKLPRYKSQRSGEVFARLTSPQNLDTLKDRTLPLNVEKMQEAPDMKDLQPGLGELFLKVKNSVEKAAAP